MIRRTLKKTRARVMGHAMTALMRSGALERLQSAGAFEKLGAAAEAQAKVREQARRVAGRARKRAGAAVIDNGFLALARAGKLHPDASGARHGIEITRHVPYRPGGNYAHTLDIYRPTHVQGPLPIVLYCHGGGFRILSKDTHWVMGLAFARAGYLVFNINYRLSDEAPFPAAAEDACTAYAWMIEHAARWGGDPARVVVAGESAGANLALVLELAASWRRPERWAQRVFDTGVTPVAALIACGILQVSDPERHTRRKGKLPAWLFDRVTEVGEAYLHPSSGDPDGGFALADPLVVLEQSGPPERPLPPTLAFVGTRDVLIDDTRRLVRALAERGVPHASHYYPGEVHAFHAMLWRESARKAWRDTFSFLQQHVGPFEPAAQAALRGRTFGIVK